MTPASCTGTDFCPCCSTSDPAVHNIMGSLQVKFVNLVHCQSSICVTRATFSKEFHSWAPAVAFTAREPRSSHSIPLWVHVTATALSAQPFSQFTVPAVPQVREMPTVSLNWITGQAVVPISDGNAHIFILFYVLLYFIWLFSLVSSCWNLLAANLAASQSLWMEPVGFQGSIFSWWDQWIHWTKSGY